MKICIKCGVPKELSEFRVDRGYVRSECRECAALIRREWYAKNPEPCKAAARKWSKNNPEKRNESKRQRYHNNKQKHKNYVLKRSYGIPLSEFNRLVELQNGCCAICGGPPRSKPSFCVDHDHVTGKVRGLLCSPCNSALGFLNDDFSLTIRAADYLRRTS
jgi:hypothetical protein